MIKGELKAEGMWFSGKKTPTHKKSQPTKLFAKASPFPLQLYMASIYFEELLLHRYTS